MLFCYVTAPCRGGRGEKSGPGVSVRPAHSIHGARPTKYTPRCPLNGSRVSNSQWPSGKNTHTLNIILDDYKEITSNMYVCFLITFGSTDLPGWTHGIK